MAGKRVRKPPQAPPNFAKSAISIIDDAKRLIEQSRRASDNITQNVQPQEATFATVMVPLAHAQNALRRESKVLTDFENLSPDRGLRDASKEASRMLAGLGFEKASREDLFKLIDAVVNKNEHLDPESRTLLQMQHKAYICSGIHLSPLQRERLKQIRQRRIDLNAELRNVSIDSSAGTFFRLEELVGVSEEVISRLEKKECEDEVLFKVPYRFFASNAVMQQASSGETRKRYVAGWPQLPRRKEEIFKEIVLLRDEAARLLGYPDHATFQIEERVAKTPDTVNAFLADLRERLIAGGAKELEVLKQLKKADLKARGELFDGRFYVWDRRYYERMLLETEYLVDEERIAEYFPLQETVSGMLCIFEYLFGLAFEEIVGEDRQEATVWHKDVRLFSVWDSDNLGGGFLGFLYLDLYEREHKYCGVGNFNLQPGFTHLDGTRHYPSTLLVCNFEPPSTSRPCLLQHQDRITLFHELGHGIHDLVSKTRYACCHGPPATPVDFGEAPSQMLENWCWRPDTLKALSKHWSYLSPQCLNTWKKKAPFDGGQPPEQIPDDILEKLVATRNVNGALFQLVVLQRSIFDMAIYRPETRGALQQMDFGLEWARLSRDLIHFDEDDKEAEVKRDNRFLMIPQFVDDGDYDAGYYSYLL